MNNILLASAIVVGVLISACSYKQHQVWTAIRSTPVYASESDGENEVVFTLTPGDTCTPLRDIVMKAYLHTEIQCKSGRGWVVDKRNFSIRPMT